jgi:DNA-binding MarR family transcriptional regulator
VTLNISREQSKPDEPTDATRIRDTASSQKQALVEEAVEELSSWNPREFMRAFRHWHRGALSLTHLSVLGLVDAEGPLSMSRLADALDVSVASMTGIVDRMEKQRLVERRRDESDRRVVLVVPGPGGTEVFREIDKRRREALGKLLTGLTEEELSGLLRGHRALRAARAEMAGEAAT